MNGIKKSFVKEIKVKIDKYVKGLLTCVCRLFPADFDRHQTAASVIDGRQITRLGSSNLALIPSLAS